MGVVWVGSEIVQLYMYHKTQYTHTLEWGTMGLD